MNRLLGVGTAILLASTPLAATSPASASDRPGCTFSPSVHGTTEEQRLSHPIPQQLLRDSGLQKAVADFSRSLCATRSVGQARTVTRDHGHRLWKAAVRRAQQYTAHKPAAGTLSNDDDRPLYWARLSMTLALRQWNPAFTVSSAQRGALLELLESTSRGQDTISFGKDTGVKRILLTGFDPFDLDWDSRTSNPSGAVALALDGVTVQTPSGPARIETAVFPVRWQDFADGTVERTLAAHFRPGPQQVDMFATVSQGQPDRFDIERWNGAWRGGYQDNDNLSSTGTIPIPAGLPTVHPQPQWTHTTLPYQAIVQAATGRFPVYDHTQVTEIPAGGTKPVVRPNGPTPGSVARGGGGGDYLSNEIAYRATLLRDALDPHIPGGHIHTPVLEFGAGNSTDLNDPTFLRNRGDIVAQTRAIVTAAAATLGTRR
ncbi:pyroglutamyl peptidase [Streptomyces sp. NPDC002521]